MHPETGRLQVLVIERKDSGQKALPGGMVDEGEVIATTVARELSEETGATLSFDGATTVFTGVVDDPRNTDNAWVETTVLHKHLTAAEQNAMIAPGGRRRTGRQLGERGPEPPVINVRQSRRLPASGTPGLEGQPGSRAQVNEILKR